MAFHCFPLLSLYLILSSYQILSNLILSLAGYSFTNNMKVIPMSDIRRELLNDRP